MKSRFLKSTPFIAVAVSLLGLCGCGGKNTAESLTGITSFSYGYSAGTHANSGCDYTADLEDGNVKVTVRPDSSQEVYAFETGYEFMDKLTEIANEYKISSWDGFNKSSQNILDGDSFSLSLETDSGQSVSAHGYVSRPENYSEAASHIEALFMELYESHYPNKQQILQDYLDEVLIPEYGLLGNEDGNTEISYPYLSASEPGDKEKLFNRGIPDIEEGILGYAISDLFNTYYESGPDTDYYMLVYMLTKQDDCLQLSFKYYTVDESYKVVQLGGQVVDEDLFTNDGIYCNLGKKSTEDEQLLLYSGCQQSIADKGSKFYFLSIFRLNENGCELLNESMVTGTKDKDDWNDELIDPLLNLAQKYGLDEESKEWAEYPYDPVLKLDSKQVSILTSNNIDSGFNDAISKTEMGQPVGDYQVEGSIYAVHYGYNK